MIAMTANTIRIFLLRLSLSMFLAYSKNQNLRRCSFHQTGDPHLLWFILMTMDKISRVIFAVLFLLASFNNSETGAKGLSAITPVTITKAQGRSAVIARTVRPVPVGDSTQMNVSSIADLSDRADKEKFPCASLQITEAGAVCDGYRLDFPEVVMKDILEGGEYLPRQSKLVFFSEKVVDGTVYQNFALILRWEPATPEFLQVYLEEYLPYWEDRVPYRLFWSAVYEVCSENCSTFDEKGEFLPSDIENLSPSLAADIDFNGVPVAFWNENIKPSWRNRHCQSRCMHYFSCACL